MYIYITHTHIIQLYHAVGDREGGCTVREEEHLGETGWVRVNPREQGWVNPHTVEYAMESDLFIYFKLKLERFAIS